MNTEGFQKPRGRNNCYKQEAYEGVKWELGFAFFLDWENGTLLHEILATR